jgi:hypothetical protein
LLLAEDADERLHPQIRELGGFVAEHGGALVFGFAGGPDGTHLPEV